MSNVLEEICARKREHIEAKQASVSLDDLKYQVTEVSAPRGFIQSMMSKAPFAALIAEVKKASPSKGIIRENFNPAEIAKAYEVSGAACISVLTDEPFFQGSDEHLKEVRDATCLPVLRKDFMLDKYQIYESRALGADCILLIMAALSDDEAKHLNATSMELGMDVLVEVHNEEELERALAFQPNIIGVNSRNLVTMDVDLNIAHTLASKIPDIIYKIAESGIAANEDIISLKKSGFSGFLVGETLLREDNIGLAVQHLLQN